MAPSIEAVVKMAKPMHGFADWNMGHSEQYLDKEMIQLIQVATKQMF